MTPENLATKSLEAFFSADFEALSPRRKHLLVLRFGRFLHSLFEAGVQPRSLELGQFTIGDWQRGGTFGFADTGRFRHRRKPLSERQRFACLAQLYARMQTVTTRNQRFRFMRAVYGEEIRHRDVRALVLRLETAALPLARRHWRRQARLSLDSNARFTAARRGPWRTWSRRSTMAASLLDALLPDPEKFFQQGRSMGGRGAGCTSSRVDVGGRPFFIKRYYQPGLRYRVKYLFMPSKALATWLSGWQFRTRGLPTAEPLVLMERRRFFFLRDAYLVFEFCESGRPLAECWPLLTAQEKRDLVIRGAQLLAKAHRCCCIHGDTNWNNILLGQGGEMLLVDLDCAKIMPAFNYARAYRDLWHFIRDLRRKRNNGVAYIDLFVSVWRRWLGEANRVSRARHERVVQDNPGRMFDDCI